MRLPRLIPALFAIPVLLTACSETVDGHPARPTAAAFPTDIAALGAKLAAGANAVKSAHIELSEDAAGQSLRASGDEKLNNGEVEAMALTETVGSQQLKFTIIARIVYAQLPAAVYAATKPWVQIDENTSDPTLAQLYTSFVQSAQNGTGKNVDTLVAAAKSLNFKGTEQFDGVEVGHYALVVDVTKLPADFPNRAALEQSGLTAIPIELDVDGTGLSRRVTEDFTVSGHEVKVEVELTKIDEPVTIDPPPADQVEQP